MKETKTLWQIDPSIPRDRDSVSFVINYGITKFDSIGDAYLTIFQCTTLEGWTRIKVIIEDWMLGFSTSVMSNAFVHLEAEDGKGQDEIGVQNDDIG